MQIPFLIMRSFRTIPAPSAGLSSRAEKRRSGSSGIRFLPRASPLLSGGNPYSYVHFVWWLIWFWDRCDHKHSESVDSNRKIRQTWTERYHCPLLDSSGMEGLVSSWCRFMLLCNFFLKKTLLFDLHVLLDGVHQPPLVPTSASFYRRESLFPFLTRVPQWRGQRATGCRPLLWWIHSWF